MDSSKSEAGDYLWRGGRRIELEREEEFFTAMAKDEAEAERVRSLPGVVETSRLQNRVLKVRVLKDTRDEAMEKFRSKEVGGICHHAYRPKKAAATRYYLTDEIVVRFRPEVAKDSVEHVLSQAGVRLLKAYPDAPGSFLVQVTAAAGMNPVKVANALAEREEVEFAEPNLVNRYQKSYIPTDTYFRHQWHLRAWNGPYVVKNADVSAVEAWDVTRGKREVVIGIIDDGFDLSHPDFDVEGKIVHPKDYVDGDADPFPVTEHQDYHGTPCAGVALAEETGDGVVGMAPGCAFMPVRWGFAASDDLMVEIFDYVGKRADVISCSWGPPPSYAPLSSRVAEKLDELAASGGPRKKGCVIVFAAGNYNAPLNDPNNTGFVWRHPVYGLMNTQEPILNGEATHPGVIAVSASTSLNKKAAYSNWGNEVSVCAPSHNGHPTDPTKPLPGLAIWTTDNEEFGTDFTGGSRFTGVFGGTSSATPLVAGVAALVISANPALTAAQVGQILQETADKIEDHDPDPALGLTKGTYDAGGHSEWFGYGKVNAARAVQRARDLHREHTGVTELALRAEIKGSLAGTGSTQHLRVTVGSKLRISLAGPDGRDFDLYVKRGAPPTPDDYDDLGYSETANEQIVIDPLVPGEYYVMVRSYSGAGDFEVSAEMEA